MLLTRLWSTVLALAASAALVLVFLVGAGATGDFTKEERSAIMGIADGGLVALEADLQSSAVVNVPQLLATPRLRAAIRGEMFSRRDWAHPPGTNLIGWARRHGASPIVYLAMGDGPNAYANPGFRKVLENAVRWVASEEAHAWAASG